MIKFIFTYIKGWFKYQSMKIKIRRAQSVMNLFNKTTR